MSVGDARSRKRHGGFWQNQTFNLTAVNDRLCEGFRALAYESLQCRNPRTARAGLWVKRFCDGLGRQALVVRQCSQWSDRSGFVGCRVANDIGFAGDHALRPG